MFWKWFLSDKDTIEKALVKTSRGQNLTPDLEDQEDALRRRSLQAPANEYTLRLETPQEEAERLARVKEDAIREKMHKDDPFYFPEIGGRVR